MKSLQDAVDHRRDISEGEASYPQLPAALGSMNAEIAVARVLEVESAMRDIWQMMNDLRITLGLSHYRSSRSERNEISKSAGRGDVERTRKASWALRGQGLGAIPSRAARGYARGVHP
jgi:hypothetical protein